MKLSEAIRLGAMLKPQGFGMVSDGTVTCAFGGAIEAAGCPVQKVDSIPTGYETSRECSPGAKAIAIVPEEWIDVLSAERHCHLCQFEGIVHRLIAHLNDHHRMTREEIADRVEAIEQELAPVSAEAEMAGKR